MQKTAFGYYYCVLEYTFPILFFPIKNAEFKAIEHVNSLLLASLAKF